MSSPAKITILFHGNCIDGWFSAYIAHSVLKNVSQVQMFPISPNQRASWPKVEKMVGTAVLMLDVSIPCDERKKMMDAGVLSFDCIDHHESAVEQWHPGFIDTRACAALQTWLKFYPGQAVPQWLLQVDRIDRWDNPTYEDRVMREALNIIAHKPVEKKMDEAFALTEAYFRSLSNPEEYMGTFRSAEIMLQQKEQKEMELLQRCGVILVVGEEHVKLWNLPVKWLGLTIFLINNTGITLDTTDAANLLFRHRPDIAVFINYRKKFVPQKGATPAKNIIVYSARAQNFDITSGTVLKGHPTSAGASLTLEKGATVPFVIGTV
jgi:hypothetical protein